MLVVCRNRAQYLKEMSLSFEGRVVLVTGAGGGKIAMQTYLNASCAVIAANCKHAQKGFVTLASTVNLLILEIY